MIHIQECINLEQVYSLILFRNSHYIKHDSYQMKIQFELGVQRFLDKNRIAILSFISKFPSVIMFLYVCYMHVIEYVLWA